ncbi:uncharacterized protein LOC143911774 [Arctopsyche grandis]|uniref:uncharacterized protein LOC143911774 n=1 Tax=Arctopsyche grandis TaxID=121162 RepID=UPI00406D9044
MERRTVSRRKQKKSKEASLLPPAARAPRSDPDLDPDLDLDLDLDPDPECGSGLDADHDHDHDSCHDSCAVASAPPCEEVAERLAGLRLTNGTNGGAPHEEAETETETETDTDADADARGAPETPPSVCGPTCAAPCCALCGDVCFESYQSELQMADIMKLIQKDLSEPYSIYTYRYFIHNWPKLCFLAMHRDKCIGAIVCKLDLHRTVKRGYIAMLAVDQKYRKRKIGSKLVTQAISVMISDGADEVVLETEITNKPALRLYENLGFVRDKRLFRYYLNGVDALRLKLWLR